MNSTTRRTAYAVALLTLAALLVSALPAAASFEQPDAQIRGGAADASLLGDNIYNLDGAGQTKKRMLRPGESDSFRFMLQNDYFADNIYNIEGQGSTEGFIVRYFKSGVDVTDQITGGGLDFDCLSNTEMDGMKIVVTARRNAQVGSKNTTLVGATGFSNCGKDSAPISLGGGCAGICDTIGVEVTVRNDAGDRNGQTPR